MATLYMTVGDDVFPSYVGDKDIYLSDFLKTYTINLFEMIEIEKLIKSSFTI